MTSALEWQFGGWLRSWPASVAWAVLLVLALGGLWLVYRSYRVTTGSLSSGRRLGLASLRGVLLLLLLLCLANPTRVTKQQPERSSRELAVLVDSSSSMSQPDSRGATRLADAVRVWKSHESEAAEVFTAVRFYRFSTSLESVADFKAAVKSREPGPETHLYASLKKALTENPAAVVCLTDGLDTTSDKMSDALAAATGRGAPLYFVVGNNRIRASGESMKIREVRIPARVLRQSHFTATALIEIFSPVARELAMELWSGNRRLATTTQPVQAGMHTLPWPVEIAAGEPALMPLEFRIGTGAQQQIAGRTTRIVENASMEILYYQGALQWGYRFLRSALESDPSFRVTAILNPVLGLRAGAGAAGPSTPADLPGDARELKRFQIVVLAYAFADLLTPKQQRALVEYARGGGGVLFISPDTEATRRFSGSPLEEMLPVVFEAGGSSRTTSPEMRIEEGIHALGFASVRDEDMLTDEARARQLVPELKPFTPAPTAAGARLFRASGDVPRFETYAKVRTVKPGAEILAVHPADRSPVDNSPRVLVARQQFGDGFTAAMNTDLLWRWKLSLASTNRAAEVFWQQFFLALAQPAQTGHLDLTCQTASPQVNRAVSLRVSGVAGTTPTLDLRSPNGKQQRLTLAAATSGPADTWEASFTPDAEGCWSAGANATDGEAVRISIPVGTQSRTAEQMNLPPDVDGLRQLAEATGGAIIDSANSVFSQIAAERPPEMLRAQPLWDDGWLVVLLLGIYATELVLRRIFRLL